MYITEVSGHHKATMAIEEALRALSPHVETRRINGFGYVYPIMEKIINKAYMGVIKRTPKIWDYLYDNPLIVRRTKRLKNLIHKSNHAKLAKLFDEFKPDVVVCTQAFPCGLVADYKMTYGLDTRLIGVLTDYAPHAYWLHEGVDYYVVPSDEAKERFMKEGIPAHRIKHFGIPVDPKFVGRLNRKLVMEKLGLNSTIPVVLIMGGGQGLGPIKTIVHSLIKLSRNVQLIVVAGTNKKLIRFLRKMESKTHQKMLVYEYAHNIDELMEVASLIVTKPGGMTTAESLCKGLPMVIVNPIPGQEVRNTNHLLKKGVALRINRVRNLRREMEHLLDHPEKLSEMSKAAYQISHPHSSLDIARLILQ